MGELGLYLCPTKERRFQVAFRMISLVGIGSTLFHGTLRHKMQLLGKDEEQKKNNSNNKKEVCTFTHRIGNG